MSNVDVVKYVILGKVFVYNVDVISIKGGYVFNFFGLEREVKLLCKDFK